MTESEIKKYIDRLNHEDYKETIFMRQVNTFVQVARVWDSEPELNNDRRTEIPSYRFFFIKNEEGYYIGAVLDMKRDLHWYILPEERKKGYLTRALQEAIIPYLFYDEYGEKEEQRITIDRGIGQENYQNSKRVAEKIGFKAVDDYETEFILRKSEFSWENENLEEANGEIGEERFLELQNRVILSYRELIKISDELLMTYEDDKELRDLAKKVGHFRFKIEDIEWENKKGK